MRILVLDAHANASLAIVQSLGRAGHDLGLAGPSPNPVSWKSRYPQQRWSYSDPLQDPEAFTAWLVEIQRTRSFDFILPVTDRSIYPAMKLLREGWGEGFLVLPPVDAFDWVYDKSKTMDLARDCDVRIPSGVEIDSHDWSVGDFSRFPYFAKPVQSKVWSRGGGHNLSPRLARDPTELARAVDTFLTHGTVSVQEYISGWGVGLAVLCQDGDVLNWFAYRRVHEYPLTGGASTYRVSMEPPAGLVEASSRMMEKIRWSGVAMIEFKEHHGDLVLMEINGRFWGSLPLAIAAGVDFPRQLIDLLAHGSRPAQPTDYRRGLFVRRIDTDFAWFKDNLRADKADRLLLTRPVGRSLVEPLRVLGGNEHWDHASWRDPAPIVTLIARTLGEEFGRWWRRLQGWLLLRSARFTSRRRLRRRPMRKVLILCYGNICRSPYVETYLRSILNTDDLVIRSAGFHQKGGRQTPGNFAQIAEKTGVSLGEHRSSVMDPQLVDWADAIVIMDRDNWRRLRIFGRQAMRKAVWLGACLASGSVELSDPYSRDEAEMTAIADRMRAASQELAVQLAGRQPS